MALTAVWVAEKVYEHLFENEPKFFEVLPVRWIFDAGESGILAVFVIFGVYETIVQLRSK
jgi:hypothetical protein